MAAITICSDFGAPQNYVVGKETNMYRALLCARNHLFNLKPEKKDWKWVYQAKVLAFQQKKKRIFCAFFTKLTQISESF